MSKHFDTGPGHPITRFLDLLDSELDELIDAPTWALSAAETTDAVVGTERLLARMTELETRLLRQAQTLGIPAEHGFRSLTAWLARTTHLTHTEAARRTRLATTLATHTLTRDALAHGRLLTEQAIAITTAVDEVDPTDRDHAETHLLTQAPDFDAHDLTTLGRRIMEHLDPDRADEHEARLLEKQEARARKKTRFSIWDDGEGLAHGSFAIPSAQASMLTKALRAHAAAKSVRAKNGAGTYDHDTPTPEKLGQAFVDYIERYPLKKLPKLGGMNAAIIVTADVALLQGKVKAAHLDTGVAISPGQLTRWACDARIFPAVLDTGGHVLDLGRETRLHTEPQRLALTVEQKTCQHPLCDVLAAFCHVHHVKAWADGGPTNTTHAVLLCPFHHHHSHTHRTDYPIRT